MSMSFQLEILVASPMHICRPAFRASLIARKARLGSISVWSEAEASFSIALMIR